MNLLFKKNFHESKSTSVSKGARKPLGHRTSKSTGSCGGYGSGGYSPVAAEDRYVRTHIFFSANRYNNNQDYEEKCGPVLASIASQSTNYSYNTDQELPQPLVIRGGPAAESIQWAPLSELAQSRASSSPARTSSQYANTPTPTTTQSFTYNMASSILRPNTPSATHAQTHTPNSSLRAPSPAQSSASSSPNPQKQVNFRERSTDRTSAITMKTNFNEPITLGKLDKDCFIIPMHRLSRFLPAGLPLPDTLPQETQPNRNMNVLEISEQKYSMLVHLMSPLEPVDPMLESPIAQPMLKQRAISTELLNEVSQSKAAVSGMLLANMERHTEFPFMSCYIINNAEIDPNKFYNNFRNISLNKFDPRTIRYNAAHTLDLYSEVAAICKPPIQECIVNFTKTHTPHTGYIVTVFKVFEGDDREIFERNWLYWTGARVIYRFMSNVAGLRRISLHKSVSTHGDKMYLLLCECSTLLQNISAVTNLLPSLRARLCGYTAIYRPINTF